MNKPELSTLTARFTQEGNTLGTTSEYENITIDAEFQLGENDGPFFVIKTDGWSIDSVNDIQQLIDRMLKCINFK